MLVENKKIVREEEKVVNVTSNYFTNIITHPKLKPTKNDPLGKSEKYNIYLQK